MGDAIGVSDDDGRTWHWGCDLAPYHLRRLLAVSDTEAWAVSAGLPPTMQDRTPVVELVHTKDVGRTWSSAKIPFTGVTDVEFVDSRTGWLLGSDSVKGRLMRTTDGDTWSEARVPADDTGGFGGGITFSDARNGWMAVGNPSRLYRTTDAGETWLAVEFPPQLSVYDLVSASAEQVAVGAGHYYRSGETPEPHDQTGIVMATEDGGRTWNRAEFSEGTVTCCHVAMAATSDRDLALIAGDVISTSNDGGRTWRPARVEDGWFPSSIVRGGPGRFLAPRSEEGKVLVTSDAGRSWDTLQLPYVESRSG